MKVEWLLIGGPCHGTVHVHEDNRDVLRVAGKNEAGSYLQFEYVGRRYIGGYVAYQIGEHNPTEAQLAETVPLIQSTGLAPGASQNCIQSNDGQVGRTRFELSQRETVIHTERVGDTTVIHERYENVSVDGSAVDLAKAQAVQAFADAHPGYLAQFRGQRLACVCRYGHCGGLVLAHLAEGTPLSSIDLFLRNC